MKYILKKTGLKLIKVFCDFKGDSISSIKITGDFFMHPEEAIEDVESALLGKDIKDVLETIENVLKSDNVIVFGVTAKAITEAIEGCFKSK